MNTRSEVGGARKKCGLGGVSRIEVQMIKSPDPVITTVLEVKVMKKWRLGMSWMDRRKHLKVREAKQ